MSERGIQSFEAEVSVDTIHPNRHNPNKMQERALEALREGIARFGFIDPITVRPHPELKDQFEIVDGEHRWRVARDLGIEEIPVSVIDVSDHDAKKLTITLNETSGDADKIDLASLLVDIARDDDNLLEALPWTQKELDDLLAAALMPGDDEFAGAFDKVVDGEPEFVTMTFTIPADAKADVDEALATAQSVMGKVDGNVNGHALVAICRHHLTGE